MKNAVVTTGTQSYALHEQLAIQRIKELQAREKRRKRIWQWRWGWGWLTVLPYALLHRQDPELEIAPGQTLARAEWEKSYQLLDHNRIL